MSACLALQAVQLGLLRIAPPDALFPGRGTNADTPVLADFRGAIGNVELRALIVHGLARILSTGFPEVEVVAGISRAGVPWGAMLAWQIGKPAAVVHLDGSRASGLQRQVEGEVRGRPVVLIDNLIRTGSSLEVAARVVGDAGGVVAGAMTIISCSDPRPSFRTASLWSLDELVEAARDSGQIDAATFTRLTEEELS